MRQVLMGLACLLATSGMAADDKVPEIKRDLPLEFVQGNQGRYEAYLADLQGLWAQCCADRERSFPSVSAAPCPGGDIFDTRGSWSISEQKKRPVEGGLKQLFTTEMESYRVCELPKEGGGCLIWGTRWNLGAAGKGKIGGGAATVDSGRCTVTLNSVNMSHEGYGRVDFREIGTARMQSILGSGKPLKVTVSVVGPAVMSRYAPVWQAEHGSIHGLGGFVKDGSRWTASASLVVPGEPARVRVSAKLGEGEHSLALGVIAGHPPPLDGIQLKHGGRQILLDEPLYLFYPHDGPKQGLSLTSEARLVNGQVVANWAAPGIREPRFLMEDGKVADFTSPAGVENGLHYLAPLASGETRLMAEYPQSIEFARDQTFYEMYPVKVLELTLTKVFDSAGRTALRLLARGPDPGKCRVLWAGAEAGSAPFRKEGGYWQVELPGEGVTRIQVMNPSGEEVAVLDPARRAPLEAAAIQILPPAEPAFTVFREMPLPSSNIDLAGWAISSGFCSQVSANKLPRAMSSGKDADQLQGLLGQARSMCQNQEALRQNQEQVRRIVPEINRLVRELAKGGSELVGLEEDSVAVGAAITGLSPRILDRAYCRWSLINGGESRLAFPYTPAQALDETKGGCLNRVTNLIKGFTPGMKVAVELIVGL